MALEAKIASTQRYDSEGIPIPECVIGLIPVNAKSITVRGEWVSYLDPLYPNFIIYVKHTDSPEPIQRDPQKRDAQGKLLYDTNGEPIMKFIYDFIQSNSNWIRVKYDGFSYYFGQKCIYVEYTDSFRRGLERDTAIMAYRRQLTSMLAI